MLNKNNDFRTNIKDMSWNHCINGTNILYLPLHRRLINMSMAGIYHIESWWRHNGCWDREQASGIPYCGEDNYLSITDAWWETLTDEEKEQVFNDFFEDLM